MKPTYYEIDFLDGTSKVFTSEESAHEYAQERKIVAYALVIHYEERHEITK